MTRAGDVTPCFAKNRRAAASRSAFTLIEVLVVLGLLMILCGIMFLTLTSALRLDQAAAHDYDWANTLTDLADRFRDDASASRDLPAQLGQFRADDATLPLAPVGQPPLVYHWDGKALTRTQLVAGDKPPYHETIALPNRVRSVRFERGGDGRPVVVRMIVQSERGPVGHEKSSRHEIVATVGADLR